MHAVDKRSRQVENEITIVSNKGRLALEDIERMKKEEEERIRIQAEMEKASRAKSMLVECVEEMERVLNIIIL